MPAFESLRMTERPAQTAPDGSRVRPLLRLAGGSMAHFELPAGATSAAVAHRAVEEIWYFLGGRGEMWRKLGEREATVGVEAGTCITIPAGTHFQFRCTSAESLCAVGVTMPPWPGDDEAIRVPGRWPET